MKIKCIQCLVESNKGFRDALAVYNGQSLCREHVQKAMNERMKQLAEMKKQMHQMLRDTHQQMRESKPQFRNNNFAPRHESKVESVQII